MISTEQTLSNNPPVLVELTPELAAFLLDNCDSNIEFGLKTMPTMESEDLIRALIKNMENFKSIRQAVRNAL